MPRRGRPRVTIRGQHRYIMSTYLRNRVQTATVTAANTPGLHNNRIGAQTVRNRLRFNATSSLKSSLLGTYVYTLVGYSDAVIQLFFRMNQDFLYNMVMTGCACTVGEMNAMLTVVFLNEIVLVRGGGGGVLPLPMVIVHH